MKALILIIIAILFPSEIWAQKTLLSNDMEVENVEDTDAQRVNEPRVKTPVGKKAANKYFERAPTSDGDGSRDHFLALHLGYFVDSDAYSWGVDFNDKNSDHADDPGKLSIGVTYRLGEWTDMMDLNLRVDFQTYSLYRDRPFKMSVLPLVTFPDVNSEFPIYFGAGVGPGIFFKQVAQESSLTLDYQLVAGARVFDVIENTGFFAEFGLKNHLSLLSDGQFNGVFVSGGAVFTF